MLTLTHRVLARLMAADLLCAVRRVVACAVVAVALLRGLPLRVEARPAAAPAQSVSVPVGETNPAPSQQELNEQLLATIAIFRRTPPESSDLDDVADRLGEIVEQMAPSQLAPGTLRQLAALLDLPGHPEAGQLALCLAHFGPRARPAAPKLLALLPLYNCPPPGFSSGIALGDVIRTTLRRMGVRPPAKHCH